MISLVCLVCLIALGIFTIWHLRRKSSKKSIKRGFSSGDEPEPEYFDKCEFSKYSTGIVGGHVGGGNMGGYFLGKNSGRFTGY